MNTAERRFDVLARLNPAVLQNLVESLPMNGANQIYCTSCQEWDDEALNGLVMYIQQMDSVWYCPFSLDVVYDNTIHGYHVVIRVRLIG